MTDKDKNWVIAEATTGSESWIWKEC
ncbi:hypothetical protein LCGC14_2974310, partial [marine sediment metagenome]